MTLLLLVGALAQLEHHYNQGNYDSVAHLAPVYLADSATNRADSLQILKLAAFALVALGDNSGATVRFRQVLALEPELELDPVVVSPKIRAVFDAARQTARARLPATSPMRDTIFVRRPASLSVLVPGLSQIQSRRTRGYAWLGGWLATLTGIGISELQYDAARQAYLAETNPAKIAEQYKTANKWYRTRSVLVGIGAVTWLGSLVDALLSR